MIRIPTIITLSVAALAAATSLPLRAETQQVAFSYKPAEFGSVEGAKVAYKRMQRSVKRACETSSPLLKRDQQQCQRALQDLIVARVSSPTLYALHAKSRSDGRLANAD